MRKIRAKFCPKGAQRRSEKDRLCHDKQGYSLGWSIQIPQFLDALVTSDEKLDLLLWPRGPSNRVSPVGSMLALSDARRPDKGKSTHKLFDDPFFFKSTGMIYMHFGFPLERTAKQGITMFEVLREFLEEIPSEEASTLQIEVSGHFPPGQCTSPTTPSLSETILTKMGQSRNSFLIFPLVQTPLPVTFASSQSSRKKT